MSEVVGYTFEDGYEICADCATEDDIKDSCGADFKWSEYCFTCDTCKDKFCSARNGVCESCITDAMRPYLFRGSLRKFSEFGSYPLYYVDGLNNCYCAQCATARFYDMVEVHENHTVEDMTCDDCGDEIEYPYQKSEVSDEN